MKRRIALQKVALMMGTAISAPTLIAVLEGCKKSSSPVNSNFAIDQSQKALLDELTEIIIPKTSTAGAKDVGCGDFIQIMLRDCFSEAQQKSFIQGLEKVNSLAKEKGVDMVKGDIAQKNEIMKSMQSLAKEEQAKIDEKTKEIDSESGLEKKKVGEKPVVPFFNLLKDLTVFGYFTSEKGAKENLEYVPIPGKYEGCITIGPNQKAYAL